MVCGCACGGTGQLAEQSGEAAGLRSELSCLQPRSSQLSEERGGQEERTRQLAAELHRLRTASRQSLDEVREKDLYINISIHPHGN